MEFKKTFEGKRPGTIRTYASLFDHWINPYISDPKKITQQDVQNLCTTWTYEGLKPQTIKILLRLFKSYADHYSIKIDIKQISKLVLNSEQQSIPKSLTKDQAKNLIATCQREDKSFFPVLLLGLHAGLRRGEVFGLHWDDIDFLKGRILIQRSLDGPTKNGKSRSVPLSRELEKILLESDNLNRTENKKIFKLYDPNPRLKNVCQKANVSSITFHQLRHSFCTFALDSGMSPRQLADIVGHNSVTTTLSLYWSNIQTKVDLNFLP